MDFQSCFCDFSNAHRFCIQTSFFDSGESDYSSVELRNHREILVQRYLIKAVTKFTCCQKIIVSNDSSQASFNWIDAVKRLGIQVFDSDPLQRVDFSNNESQTTLATTEMSSMPEAIFKLFPDSLHGSLRRLISVCDQTPPLV